MKRFESLVIVLALGFYAWFLKRFGFKQIIDYVLMAGWGLFLTISLESVARTANTIGWRATISRCPRDLSLFRMFAARLAGDAIDYVTPSAQLGGELLRATMVRNKLSMAHGLASVTLAALAESVGQIMFVLLALLLSLRLVFHRRNVLWMVLCGLILTMVLPIAFFMVQLRRPFSHLVRAGDQLGLTSMRAAEIKAGAAEADALLLDFYAHSKARLLASCACSDTGGHAGPKSHPVLFVGNVRAHAYRRRCSGTRTHQHHTISRFMERPRLPDRIAYLCRRRDPAERL